MGRTWKMYASVSDRLTENGNTLYKHVYSHLAALSMSGVRPENVLTVDAVEDGDGEYMGWVATGESSLRMVQQRSIFSIQFPYSVQSAIDSGHGEAVPLTIREAVK